MGFCLLLFSSFLSTHAAHKVFYVFGHVDGYLHILIYFGLREVRIERESVSIDRK